MKKWLTYTVIAGLMFGCVACGTSGQENTQTESDTKQENQLSISDANEILTQVWGAYKEEEKFFAEGPMKLEGVEADYLERAFCFPAERASQIDDVAILLHSMNANTFSAAAYHLTEGADMQELAEGIKDTTLDNQWLCGIPERLIIIAVGDEYLVTAYGNGEVVENFKSKIFETYDGNTEVVVEEDI